MWWRKADPARPLQPIDYPDGTVVEAEEHTYYIKSGRRYKFTSQRVLDSWGLRKTRGSEAALANFPVAKTVMGFRDGTLLTDFEDSTLWLVSGLKRRKITNPDWMVRLNLNASDAIIASAKEVALHLEGDPLE